MLRREISVRPHEILMISRVFHARHANQGSPPFPLARRCREDRLSRPPPRRDETSFGFDQKMPRDSAAPVRRDPRRVVPDPALFAGN